LKVSGQNEPREGNLDFESGGGKEGETKKKLRGALVKVDS